MIKLRPYQETIARAIIASYGWAFHLAWIDHGVAGLIMIVVSLIGALAIFKWRKGE